MPQLNKGGEFVFGLSVINPDLTIHIPPQALSEYDAARDGKIIIFYRKQDNRRFLRHYISPAVKFKTSPYNWKNVPH